MTKLFDGKRMVGIEMQNWTGSGYTPDWSNDFFEVGGLERNEELDAYIVEDVDYCIEQAKAWEDGTDYTDPEWDTPEEIESRCVTVTEF